MVGLNFNSSKEGYCDMLAGLWRFPLSADELYGTACQAKVSGGREHVPVVGPHIDLSDLVRGQQMHGAGGAQEEIPGSGNHSRTGPPQQGFADGNEVPQSALYVLGKARGQVAGVTGRCGAFAQAAMKNGVELGQSP